MPLGIDEFLDLIRNVLVTDATVPELTGSPTEEDGTCTTPGNVQVFHFGDADPFEDTQNAMNRSKGVHVLITDMGGSSDPNDGDAPIIQAEVAVELFIDPTLRNRRTNKALRRPSQIRDSIMQSLHLNPALRTANHNFYDAKIRGYQPVADPEFVVWRITLERTIYLHTTS